MTLPDGTKGLTLDAGALILLEKGNEQVRGHLEWAHRLSLPVVVPAGALAQAWRGGRRQARIARLLGTRRGRRGIRERGASVVPLDERAARRCGLLCTLSGHSDVVDASVALCAHDRGHAVVTSDPDDIRRLDPTVPILPV